VVGIDVLGRPLDEQYVFRSQIAARILNAAMGTTVTEEIIARLLAEIIKNRPEKTRVIPFINKVDLPGGLEKARGLAGHLLKAEGAKFERVIIGQAQYSPAVEEMISR
jgi:probable selenium-dependent hydroxylase accessory protein YqeC